jgi:hypothetical protein
MKARTIWQPGMKFTEFYAQVNGHRALVRNEITDGVIVDNPTFTMFGGKVNTSAGLLHPEQIRAGLRILTP